MKNLSADNLILAYKVILSEYSLLKEIMSDADGNFMSDKFKRFCHSLYRTGCIIIIPSQSNGQVEAYIKFIKCTMKNALILNQVYI